MSAASSTLQRLKSTANLGRDLQDEGGSQVAETLAEPAPGEETLPPQDELSEHEKTRIRYQKLMKSKVLGRCKKQVRELEARAQRIAEARRKLRKMNTEDLHEQVKLHRENWQREGDPWYESPKGDGESENMSVSPASEPQSPPSTGQGEKRKIHVGPLWMESDEPHKKFPRTDDENIVPKVPPYP